MKVDTSLAFNFLNNLDDRRSMEGTTVLSLESVLDERLFRGQHSEQTISNYRYCLKRWASRGVVYVDDVNADSAAAFVEDRLQRNAVTSVKTEYAALLAVLAHLERTRRVRVELLDEIRRCAPRRPKRDELCAPFLTREQLEAYCARVGGGRSAFLARLACYTGLRASELAGLRWEDVDFRTRMLYVRRGKTGSRRVPLCAPAVELLAPLRGVGYVLWSRRRETLAKQLQRGSRASGVRVTLQLCRHTRASWWIQAGVPVAKAAKWLGHSVAVCLEYYAGLLDVYDPVVELGAAG